MLTLRERLDALARALAMDVGTVQRQTRPVTDAAYPATRVMRINADQSIEDKRRARLRIKADSPDPDQSIEDKRRARLSLYRGV